MSVRFHIERGYAYDTRGRVTQWTRETIAGAKNIHAARRELAQCKADMPFHRNWRIVKITTTRRVVR